LQKNAWLVSRVETAVDAERKFAEVAESRKRRWCRKAKVENRRWCRKSKLAPRVKLVAVPGLVKSSKLVVLLKFVVGEP
jgi:hypothetical protein